MGYSVGASSGPFDNIPDLSTVDLAFLPGIKPQQPGQLVLSISGRGEALMVPNGAGGFVGQLPVMLGYNVLGGAATIYVNNRSDGTPLRSSANGYWSGLAGAGYAQPFLDVHFVYGVTSAPLTLPASGTRTYGPPGDSGTAIFVDFARRAVTGSMELGDGVTARDYLLRDVSLTGDGTELKGKLVSSDGSIDGELAGRIVGPAGDEMLARAVVPLTVGYQPHLFTFGMK